MLKDNLKVNLKALRARKRLTQTALATKAGLSVSYICMLEQGRRSPPLDTVEQLAGALDVTAQRLLAAP